MRNMLLIIDEAQLSYQYDTLWTDFIKPISSDGDEDRRVILFSSYGSPAETPLLDGIERFRQGGRYYKWITTGEIKDYIILDFRTSKPRKARSRLYLSVPL